MTHWSLQYCKKWWLKLANKFVCITNDMHIKPTFLPSESICSLGLSFYELSVLLIGYMTDWWILKIHNQTLLYYCYFPLFIISGASLWNENGKNYIQLKIVLNKVLYLKSFSGMHLKQYKRVHMNTGDFYSAFASLLAPMWYMHIDF